jgi:hypothetical protein
VPSRSPTPFPPRRSAPIEPVGDPQTVMRLRAAIESLHAERIRLLRQRRLHVAMLGLAISLPIHVALILWLASVSLPGTAGARPPEVVFELGVLDDEQLAEGRDEFEDLPIEESAAVAGDLPSALEAAQPAIASEVTTGSLEAAGGGVIGVGGPSSGGGLGIGGGVGGTSFFGVGGRGSRFAYIVDVSGSMSQDQRLSIAFEELKRSIAALPDYAAFLVVLFSDRSFEPPFQRNGFLRATPGNVVRLKRWLDEQGPMGGTDPSAAFERIFSLDPPPDLVYFLTDGEIPQHIPSYVAQRNGKGGKRRIVIHAIAFSSDASQEALRRIARESEGTFRFVPVRGRP